MSVLLSTQFWTFRITNSLIYFGLSFQASSLGSDLYLTFAMSFAVDIPVIFVASVTNQIYGRRKVLIICMLTASVLCMATVLLSHSSLFFTFVAVLGRSSISASFAVIYMYTAEVYPTFLRSTGVGICSTISRIGGILSPFLMKLVNCHQSYSDINLNFLVRFRREYSIHILRCNCFDIGFIGFQFTGNAGPRVAE